MLNRRRFLHNASLVSLAPLIPGFLPGSLYATETQTNGRILVVIQLSGGNDGLNTVIPFNDDTYGKARTTLRIEQKDTLKLTDSLGLHPAMKPAAELFESGRLAIVQGVGYPNPNRSHFESMSIWQHARTDLAQHDHIGWLGRACDLQRRAAGTPDSYFLGAEELPVAIRGRRAQVVSMNSAQDLNLVNPVEPSGTVTTGSSDISAFIEQSLDESYLAAKQFQETTPALGETSAAYPSSRLSRHLQLVSKLIKFGGGTRVYYTSQSGYDTHSSQLVAHRQLLAEFSGALKAFLDDLKQAGLDDRVVVLAFSEFGRRVEENGSAGTDHGAAGPVFLAGSKVQSGILGEHPSMTDLDDGDLKMRFDFRQVYATLLDRWLAVDTKAVLGGEFSLLPLIA
ncbi:MAG: hypothetical protein JWM11_4326 [Planctomycetaceae bacterium]|nr:hypothetical protein [Planctomycetaceae bacterium]